MKIIFMGTPNFSVPSLISLHKAGHEIVAVYCQPPRPKGRGKKLQICAVQQVAEQMNIPIYTPLTLKKNDEEYQRFSTFKADIAIIAAYGLILPKPILEAPKLGCINIHASLLPRWRGAAPIQRAIWSGDTETGISIMHMETGLDTGPVYVQQSIPIETTTNYQTLHDNLALLGSKLITQFINDIERGIYTRPIPQSQNNVTYAKQLTKFDGEINWALSAIEIDRQIRALGTWPGAYTYLEGKLLKIIKAKPCTLYTPQNPGTVIQFNFTVSCGNQQSLQILEVQPAGKKIMCVHDYLRGNPLNIGTHLG